MDLQWTTVGGLRDFPAIRPAPGPLIFVSTQAHPEFAAMEVGQSLQVKLTRGDGSYVIQTGRVTSKDAFGLTVELPDQTLCAPSPA